MLLAGKHQVLAHRKLRKDLQQLERAADAEAVQVRGPHAGDRPAVEAHLAGGRRELAENAVEQRRLAGTVGPDEAEDFAFVHGEGHPVYGADAAEGLPQVADFEDRGHELPKCSASPSSPDGNNASRIITNTA